MKLNENVKKWHGWLFSRYIIFPLLLLALNFCFSLTKNNGEKYAKDYIANSMVVKLYVAEADFHTKLITVGFFRFGSGCLTNTEITFLNKSDNRYYRIYVIRGGTKTQLNAVVGTAICPGVGTLIGGVVGGVLGGLAGSNAGAALVDWIF